MLVQTHSENKLPSRMVHHCGQRIFKSQFCSLVFHHTVILLLLMDIRTGQSQTVTPSQTVITSVGEDIILPCHLEPTSDAVSKSLEWGRLDLDPRFVHVWYDGQNLLVNQNPSYKGRTSLSTEKLKQGDLSLKLSRVKHSDNGRYRCYFPSGRKESVVELIVGSLSSPTIAGININRSAVALQCESAGWYPEPELLWLDSDRNLLSAGPTETLRGPDDLYTVSSRVTVEKRHSNNITCRVQQRKLNQSRETHIHVSGQSQTVTPSQTIITSVGEDIILPCHLEPPSDAVSKSLEWGRLDLDPRFVHVWYEGQNLLVNQNPSYKGRTSLSTEKLKQGDLSLKLSRVKHSDNGRYRCYFPSEPQESVVELIVGSLSSPTVAGININSSAVVLQCESAGWYPEPELLWLDTEGNLLSAGHTETLRGPDDLYTVSSRVTVEKRHNNNLTCRVQQKNINQSRETHIHVSEYLNLAASPDAP
ncbi:butyrophilin-like protein 2 [Archocentrus centrarchus]|uniref:butyrophilin-like protein 2 n=1 Tax=Archocentrus centrarchus TaxID=63155 RepID=UPI0011E9CAE8|nr:butyrophilin-like protein 2 [Archocentrus centrarchus]